MTPSDKEVRRFARYMAILGPALSGGPVEGQSAKVLKYQDDSRESMTKDSDGIEASADILAAEPLPKNKRTRNGH